MRRRRLELRQPRQEASPRFPPVIIKAVGCGRTVACPAGATTPTDRPRHRQGRSSRFQSPGTITRADCAAMARRTAGAAISPGSPLLRESLSRRFRPAPTPPVGCGLTAAPPAGVTTPTDRPLHRQTLSPRSPPVRSTPADCTAMAQRRAGATTQTGSLPHRRTPSPRSTLAGDTPAACEAMACWGYDNFGQATAPAGPFTQISAGT
jgi:hypothetical protein